MLTISKQFTILFLLCLLKLQNKSVGSSFKRVSKYILFLAKLKEIGRTFLEGVKTEVAARDYSHWSLLEKKIVSPIVKFEIISPLFCCLLDPFQVSTAGYGVLWSIFCTDSETYRKSPGRSNNYLELSRENILENMMLPHWPYLTWKFVMVWFHKRLKLIFHK